MIGTDFFFLVVVCFIAEFDNCHIIFSDMAQIFIQLKKSKCIKFKQYTVESLKQTLTLTKRSFGLFRPRVKLKPIPNVSTEKSLKILRELPCPS